MKIKTSPGCLVPDVLLVVDLAYHLGISTSAARALLQTGKIPGRKVGKRWIVERGAFLRSIAPDNASTRETNCTFCSNPMPEGPAGFDLHPPTSRPLFWCEKCAKQEDAPRGEGR